LREIPEGYKIDFQNTAAADFQKEFWDQFWAYALDPAARRRAG